MNTSVSNDGLISVGTRDWVDHWDVVEMATGLGFLKVCLVPRQPALCLLASVELSTRNSTLFCFHRGICLAMGLDKWNLSTTNEISEPKIIVPLFRLNIFITVMKK